MKLKVCDGCQKETVIWKNHGGFKYCKYCWSCQKAIDSNSVQKPTDYKIPQVSSKRKKKDLEYSKLRKRFLTDFSLCQIAVKGCSVNATDVHHKFSGSDRDTYYLVQSTWLAVCRACHSWIHENPEKARILGHLK
jgi:NADH pyrophosphatase NudC (nudix superfamily)